MTDTAKTLATLIAELGLTVKAEFVPWSHSRDFKPAAKVSERSLNWRVTLQHKGHDVLTTDYGAGIGHCPSYRAGARWTIDYAAAIEHETVTGKARSWPHEPILPNSLDVIASLARDSDVLDYATFEDWAPELGYDTDSRKAESIYRACLEIALKLRAALGDANLEALRRAAANH